MRHEVLLDKRQEDGSTWREHLEAAIRKGSRKAQQTIEGTEPPETMLYLMEWAYALCGRSGATMGGLAPLSYTTIRDWADLMGIDVTALETRALLVLDAVIRNPEIDEPEPVPEETVIHAWPEKKSDG